MEIRERVFQVGLAVNHTIKNRFSITHLWWSVGKGGQNNLNNIRLFVEPGGYLNRLKDWLMALVKVKARMSIQTRVARISSLLLLLGLFGCSTLADLGIAVPYIGDPK